MDNGHFWNCQLTLKKLIYVVGNVGALHDSKLQLGEEICITKNSSSQTAHILKPLLSILNTSWRTTKTLFYYIVPHFTVCTVKPMCIHCRKVQLYFLIISRITLTLYKPDISLKQTLEAGPEGVHLRESWLYPNSNWSRKCLKLLLRTLSEPQVYQLFKVLITPPPPNLHSST